MTAVVFKFSVPTRQRFDVAMTFELSETPRAGLMRYMMYHICEAPLVQPKLQSTAQLRKQWFSLTRRLLPEAGRMRSYMSDPPQGMLPGSVPQSPSAAAALLNWWERAQVPYNVWALQLTHQKLDALTHVPQRQRKGSKKAKDAASAAGSQKITDVFASSKQ